MPIALHDHLGFGKQSVFWKRLPSTAAGLSWCRLSQPGQMVARRASLLTLWASCLDLRAACLDLHDHRVIYRHNVELHASALDLRRPRDHPTPRWLQHVLLMPSSMSLPTGWLSKIGRREPRQAERVAAWLGHWVLDASENEKAEQILRAEGVPFLARKLALRFKSERRFAQHEVDGTIVGELKTVSGKWMEMSLTHATASKGGGFAAQSRSQWEGDGVLCTISTVTGPMGGVKTTTTRHYLDGDRLVSETTSPGGTYKAFSRKRPRPEELAT